MIAGLVLFPYIKGARVVLFKMRVLAVVFVVLGALAPAWAQDGDGVEIAFRRSEKVGDRYLVETSYDTETYIRVDALTGPDVVENPSNYDKQKDGYKASSKRSTKLERLVAGVDHNQRTTDVLMKLTAMNDRGTNAKQGTGKFEGAMRFSGTIKPFWVSTFSKGAEPGTVGGLEIQELGLIACMGMDAYDYDSVFGVMGKKNVGDVWPVNGAALKDVLNASGWKVERALDVQGQVKLVNITTVNAQMCAIVEAVTEIRGIGAGVLKEGGDLDSAKLTMTTRVALPLEMSQPARVLKSEIKGRWSVRAQEGRNAVVVDISAVKGEEKIKALPAETEERVKALLEEAQGSK